MSEHIRQQGSPTRPLPIHLYKCLDTQQCWGSWASHAPTRNAWSSTALSSHPQISEYKTHNKILSFFLITFLLLIHFCGRVDTKHLTLFSQSLWKPFLSKSYPTPYENQFFKILRTFLYWLSCTKHIDRELLWWCILFFYHANLDHDYKIRHTILIKIQYKYDIYGKRWHIWKTKTFFYFLKQCNTCSRYIPLLIQNW